MVYDDYTGRKIGVRLRAETRYVCMRFRVPRAESPTRLSIRGTHIKLSRTVFARLHFDMSFDYFPTQVWAWTNLNENSEIG